MLWIEKKVLFYKNADFFNCVLHSNYLKKVFFFIWRGIFLNGIKKNMILQKLIVCVVGQTTKVPKFIKFYR